MSKIWSENAINIYKALYFDVTETQPEQTHHRVAKFISGDDSRLYDIYLNLLNNDIFRPNTPCMINSRLENDLFETHDKNLVACFVLGLEDNMKSIIEMWGICATVYAGGGGTGIPLSNLREAGASISSGGQASGSLTYLKTIQNISETVKSGGKSRRAANLASFWYQHPDILEFITCKNGNDFNSVNISVLVDDFFMTHIYNNTLNKEIDLVSPNKNKVVKQITIGKIWDSIIDNAWNNGDPGLLFKTTANKYNPMKSLGEMTVSNPCLPSWAPVLTSNGYKQFIDVGNEIVLNGESLTCSNIFETGKNREIYKIKLESGLILYATEEHGIYTSSGKVELKNINLNTEIEMDYTPIQFKLDIEEYLLGLEYVKIYPEIKYITIDLLNESISYQLGFIDGVISYSNNVEIKKIIVFKFQTNVDLIMDIQLILSSVGIYSEINELYHLNIIDIEQFKNIFNITFKEKSNIINNLKYSYVDYIKKLKKYQKPKSIDKLESIETVYDITVPDKHKFVSSGCVISNCGEVLLPDNFCCNLGSINLNKCLDYNLNTFEYSFNWEIFKTHIGHSVRFLDSVIDKTSYPSKKFENNMKLARPIGLGLMGWADILFKLKLRYGSIESINLFSKICKFLTCEAFKQSLDLAKTLGSISFNSEDYTNFINLLEYYGLEDEDINTFKETGIRNCTVTSVAPTGSVSISASCSYSFEPSMALIWEKELIDRNITLKFFNQQFKNECEIRNIELTDDIISQIINNKGSIQKLNFPSEMKEVFVVAHDINYIDKIEMQFVGQRYITLGMSSTCNLPNSATKEEVANIFKLAWKKNLKGITVYRDGSQTSQPIGFGKNEDPIINPIKLPNKRSGNTIKIETPNGSLYVICNKVNGKIAEIFLLMGTLGKLEFLLINTLSKIISKSLQYRVPIDIILNQMQEIGTDKFWFKLDEEKNYMTSAESIIDAIAKIIRYHFNDETVDGYKLIKNEEVCILLNEKISDNYQYCPICKRKTLALNIGCRGGICQNPECHFTSCG
jgi:ribonucleotide reductase alpha subunit